MIKERIWVRLIKTSTERVLCAICATCDFEKKMRKYWNAFKDGCKGRDVSEMGCVMEENFVMSGISTSSAT